MGNELFGVDIAGIINQTIAPGVLPATLIKTETTPHPTKLTGTPSEVETPYSCRGFTEKFSIDERSKTEVLATDVKIILIGDSIEGGKVPMVNDSVTIEGATYLVKDVLDRDPAAATYTLQGRL